MGSVDHLAVADHDLFDALAGSDDGPARYGGTAEVEFLRHRHERAQIVFVVDQQDFRHFRQGQAERLAAFADNGAELLAQEAAQRQPRP